MSGWGDITDDDLEAWEALPIMASFSVRCGKCENVKSANYDDVFQFMAALRVQGWQVPDAIENQPILCPTCKAAAKP